jgi:hypothetical protein
MRGAVQSIVETGELCVRGSGSMYNLEEACQVHAVVAAQVILFRQLSGVSAQRFRDIHGKIIWPVVLESSLSLPGSATA